MACAFTSFALQVGIDAQGRGFLHYHDEGGHGSGGWEDGDDGDSSGPGRPHASTVKRAGGTGMTEEELAALDPKRVRRIIANRQVSSFRAPGEIQSGFCGGHGKPAADQALSCEAVLSLAVCTGSGPCGMECR